MAELFLLGRLEGRYGKETHMDEATPEASEPEAGLDDHTAGEFGHRVGIPDSQEANR